MYQILIFFSDFMGFQILSRDKSDCVLNTSSNSEKSSLTRITSPPHTKNNTIPLYMQFTFNGGWRSYYL